MLSLDPPEVVESGSSVLWYTVVWPRGKVVLHHLTRGTTLTSMLNSWKVNHYVLVSGNQLIHPDLLAIYEHLGQEINSSCTSCMIMSSFLSIIVLYYLSQFRELITHEIH